MQLLVENEDSLTECAVDIYLASLGFGSRSVLTELPVGYRDTIVQMKPM